MAEALPHAELVHAIQGRSRLRISDRRGDPVFFASLASGLSTFQGVQDVSVNSLTGSILIHHDVPLDVLAKRADDARLFELSTVTAAPIPTAAQPLDMRMLAGLGFAALALLQLSRGQVLPQAATLAWYAAAITGWLPQEAPPADSDGG